MREFIKYQKLMGTAFSLGVVAEDEAIATQWLADGIGEIQRIETLLSEFLPTSDTSKINQRAGKEWVQIEAETYALIERALHISELTNGDFDITVKPLKKLYQFDNEHFEMPPESLIKKTLQTVGYTKIALQNAQVRFSNIATSLSFAAIGKGYASDKVKKLWQTKGVTSGFVNASGDLSTFGTRADGNIWKIGIANPDKPTETLLYVPLSNASVATSGDYEQYFYWKGTRYSHNLNPHTGLPLTGVKSVSVFSPSAELSDALATAVYVKGVQQGLDFLNQLPQTHGIIIDDQNRIHFSNQITYEKATENI